MTDERCIIAEKSFFFVESELGNWNELCKIEMLKRIMKWNSVEEIVMILNEVQPVMPSRLALRWQTTFQRFSGLSIKLRPTRYQSRQIFESIFIRRSAGECLDWDVSRAVAKLSSSQKTLILSVLNRTFRRESWAQSEIIVGRRPNIQLKKLSES